MLRMSTLYIFIVLSLFLATGSAFRPISRNLNTQKLTIGVDVGTSSTKLYDVPLELEGRLDPNKKWTVKFIYNGEEKDVEIDEGTCVLEAAEKEWDDIDSSCRNGVCTTCAGQVCENRENTLLAVHGLGNEAIDAGFVCTCQTYITGPNVVVKLGTADEVYETQYGKYEVSYEMKYDKSEDAKPKKKGLFGGWGS